MTPNVRRKLNPGLPLQKQHSTRGGKKNHQQTGLNFEKTPIKHIWGTGLFGNGTWAIRTADHKCTESSKM
jgi:hypothetical protein